MTLLLGLRFAPPGDADVARRAMSAALHGFAASRGARMVQLDSVADAVGELVDAVQLAGGRVVAARVHEGEHGLRLELDHDVRGGLGTPTGVAAEVFSHPIEGDGRWTGDLRVTS